jgi:colanic acid/amylovoran biosynthesis glycosyltransferase
VQTPTSKKEDGLDRWGISRRLRLTYLIGTYPRLTTTFIDREIRLLRRLGVDLRVISIRRPHGLLSSAQVKLQTEVYYVLPAQAHAVLWSHISFLLRRPAAYVGTLFHLVAASHPSFSARLRTVLHFGLGVHIARVLRDSYPTDHIHAHFLDRATLVALIIGRLLDKPFSATGHGTDIYVAPVLLRQKMAEAKFVAAVSRYSESHLRATVHDGSSPNLRCIYNGIETRRYRTQQRTRREPPLLLSVGQLKETKGFEYLLEACAHLRDRGYRFGCEIVGEGPLARGLENMIDRLHLSEHASLLGALPHEAVMEMYRQATIFILPCVTARNGARDSIPTVILEAMAMGLPVVSTDLSGIPEAVAHNTTGVLVRPQDPMALADAVARLLEDRALCDEMGRQARLRVEEMFDAEVNVRTLLQEFMG